MAHAIYAAVALSLVQISTQVTRGDWELSVTASPSGPILEGSNATLRLTCLIITGSGQAPTGWIQWQHSPNRALYSPLTEPTYAVFSDSLTLAGVSRNQTGWYRCAGSSLWTSSYWNPNTFSNWTAVDVLYSPEITNKDRTWIGANDNYTATLECIVRGNPLPTVTWYGPNYTIVTNDTEPDRISLEDTITGDGASGYLVQSRVVIAPVVNSSDYGMYRCRAANNVSTDDRHEIELTETGNPEAPRNLRVYYLTETNIWVAWELGYDGGEELEAHYVNLRKIPWNFDPNGWIERCPPTSARGYFSYLEQGTLYQAAAYAFNKHGASPYGTVDQRTRPDSPDNLGIRVTYNVGHQRIVVTGMPRDSYDGTCLRLVGYDNSQGDWVSLRPDLDCIQRDGEFSYSGPNDGHIHCRYCYDGLCSLESHVSEVFPTTARLPLRTWPNHSQNTYDVVAVSVGVSIGLITTLVLTLGACYYFKCLNGCVKTGPSGELTRTALPRPPAAEVFEHVYDAPPSYNEALGMDAVAGNTDNPPPAYEYLTSSCTTASQESVV